MTLSKSSSIGSFHSPLKGSPKVNSPSSSKLTPKSSVIGPFRSPLKSSLKVNLSEPSHPRLSDSEPLHTLEPSYLKPAEILKKKSNQVSDTSEVNNQVSGLNNNSNTVIKNYYNINAKYVTITKKRKKH